MSETGKNARIILEDGTEFEGFAFGHASSVSAEIVFYTGQGDIARILSDPALKDTIVVIAQPSTGSCSVQDSQLCPLGLEKFLESSAAQITGLVVAHYAENIKVPPVSKTLSRWLRKHGIPGISGIDTRALIQRLCQRGTMRAKILIDGTRDVSFSTATKHNHPLYVSVKQRIMYGNGTKKIIAVDCGIKNSSIRKLVSSKTSVIRVPWNTDYSAEDFDAVFIGGGPGDPTACEKTIEVLRSVLLQNKPIFATGQGAVILALAGGASAYRMAQGHHGTSVPCIDLQTGRCYITAQNHGYGIRDESLPPDWSPLFLDNTTHTTEGFSTKKGLFSGVLFQPEGKPGPEDTSFLFDRFLSLIENGEHLK